MTEEVEKKKRQIILVRVTDGAVYDAASGSNSFMESVGQWDEVTDEEFLALEQMQYREYFRIIERNPPPFNQKNDNLRTPQDYIAEWRKLEAESEARRAERKKTSEADALKKKRKQLEKLKKELGET
jgi:hypothetical protein